MYCDQCGMVFHTVQNLKNHITMVHIRKEKRRTTKSEILKECSYCQKKFRNRSNWMEHVKVVHEKVYNFDCPDCPRKFFVEGVFKSHKVAVHDKIPCDICGMGPFNKFTMVRHKSKTHGLEPEGKFQCDTCEMYFETEKRMLYHKSKVHYS